ncbi:MAG TPA: zinc-binding dehydrogenase [Solirubrobacteraceae bacterium]|jgi:NADPH:quinone reductase-like Zn-dependent oxidoreductase|nr:zinc-binding dehydrogenase [Solirubrobacteraceae bacterium]
MRAVQVVSQDREDPVAGVRVVDDALEPSIPPGWEVVDVRAAALNHHDLWALRGVSLPAERMPMILGSDAAGVAADGREVIVHAVISDDGDRVSLLSDLHPGTLAERVAAPSANLVEKPPALTFEQAACLPTAYLTAFRMLFVRGELRPGQRVLIQGAGGGVATAAVILAAHVGAHVIATSRRGEMLKLARSLGAHEALATGTRLERPVDLVIETVGEATFEHSLASVRPHGKVVIAGGTSGTMPTLPLRRVYFGHLDILGSTMGTVEDLSALAAMLAASGARPAIDSVRPLAEAPAAFARMQAGQTAGKLVLRVP